MLEFIGALQQGEIAELLAAAEPSAAAGTAPPPQVVPIPAQQPAPQPAPPPANPFAGIELELPGAVVHPAPASLAEALEFGSSAASALVGKYFIYKWPPRLGGWALGKITEVNLDESLTVNGAKDVANFHVFYEVDDSDAHHWFSLENYAASAKSPTSSWALLDSRE